jgi:hypothetical protein
MPKLNPRAYIKKCDAQERENKRKLQVAAQIMEKTKPVPRKSGRKTKKEKEVEDRMKDQAAFLLYLEKAKEEDSSTAEE